ncbi:MAG: hypothetical protein GY946_20275 [bacterium]|nr:hypothetical protein [bacterium]
MGAVTITDDFDDNSMGSDWFLTGGNGNGLLTETNQRLEFTAGVPTGNDSQFWTWFGLPLQYASTDWEAQIDVTNLVNPSGVQYSGFGIQVYTNAGGGGLQYLSAELQHYGNGWEGFASYLGANTAFTPHIGVSAGAVRVVYDSATSVLSALYDIDPSNGYSWTSFASWGLAGSGGANGNVDWGMAPDSVMFVVPFGASTDISIASGELYGDNFSITVVPEPSSALFLPIAYILLRRRQKSLR